MEAERAMDAAIYAAEKMSHLRAVNADLLAACDMRPEGIDLPTSPDILVSIADVLDHYGHTMKANWLRRKAEAERAAIAKAKAD